MVISMHPIVQNILDWDKKDPLTDFTKYIESNEQILIQVFRNSGFEISSIWKDLVNPKPNIQKQMPKITQELIDSLGNSNVHPRILSGVVRVLGNSEIVKHRDLYTYLTEIYVDIPPSASLKNPQARGIDQSFASSISAHFKMDYFEKHKQLMLNEKLGESRGLLLIALANNVDNSIIKEFAESLRSHKLFATEIKNILKKTKKG